MTADALADQGIGMFDEGEQAVRRGEVSLEHWAVTDQQLRVHLPQYAIAPGRGRGTHRRAVT